MVDAQTFLVGASQVGLVLWYIVIMALVVGGAYFAYVVTQYKVKYRLKIITNNRTLEFDDRARIIKKKGEPPRWRLLRRREYVPVPPSEAIQVSTKGKLSVSAYYTEDGEYVYINQQFDNQKKVGSEEPLTAGDKEFYLQGLEKEKLFSNKNWQEVVVVIAPYVAVILILVMFMIFFEKAVGPTIELGNQLTQVSEKLSTIIENGQVLKVE